MKKLNFLLTIALCFGTVQLAFGQCTSPCNIDLQNDGTFFNPTPFTDIASGADIDIVAGQAQPTLTGQMFDILDAASTTCGVAADGMNDYTVNFELESYFDVYGGNTIATNPTGNDAGHYIIHGATGFQGSNATGTNTSTTNTSTGDVSCYNIEICFDAPQDAQDVNVEMTSINTAGESFESTSVVFADASCTPYGTATYNGFWNGTPQGSNGGTNTTMINVEADMYTTTGTGVFIAADPGIIDVTDPTMPVAATDGPNNDATINAATDAGLNATDQVGGFVFRVCLEDVATTAVDDESTSSSTSFTSTLNSFDVCLDADVECSYTADVAFTESCGNFTIDVTNIVPVGTATASPNIEYSTDGGTIFTAYMAGATLPADGVTSYIIRLVDAADASCFTDVATMTAPAGTTPAIYSFPGN